MPAPVEFHIAFMAELANVLSPAIDKAWDAGQRAMRTGVITPPKAPTPKPRGTRLGRGAARQAVLSAVKAFPDKGATREQIRKILPNFTKGMAVPENTLKKVLMVLREEGVIETRNSRWWPVDMPALVERSQERPRRLRIDE